MIAALFVVGALLLTAGAALISWPLGLVAAGALCLAAAADLSRGDRA